MEFELSQLQMIVAALTAWAMDLIPPLKKWWDANLNSKQKQGAMIAFMFLLAVGGALYQCYGKEGICPADGWSDYIVQTGYYFIVNLVVSAGSHMSVRYVSDPKEARGEE